MTRVVADEVAVCVVDGDGAVEGGEGVWMIMVIIYIFFSESGWLCLKGGYIASFETQFLGSYVLPRDICLRTQYIELKRGNMNSENKVRYERQVAEPIPPVAPVTRARWEERSLVSIINYDCERGKAESE